MIADQNEKMFAEADVQEPEPTITISRKDFNVAMRINLKLRKLLDGNGVAGSIHSRYKDARVKKLRKKLERMKKRISKAA